MRNVFEEYRQGLITWDKAFAIANNNAAKPTSQTDYWADQMESLGVDMAELVMTLLGYKQNLDGTYFMPEQ